MPGWMFAMVLSGAAQAHVGAALEGIDVTFPGPSLQASFGLLHSEDGRSFEWICHEVVTAEGAVIAPRYTRSQAGTWLVTVPALAQAREAGEPVYRSTDLCDWTAVDGLEGLEVNRVVFDPGDDQVAIAVTDELGEGAVNGIYRSADGGLTWAPVAETLAPERLFRAVVFDPLVPGRAYASAVWYDDGLGWLYTSDDSGQSWTAHPVPVPSSGDGTLYDVDVVEAHDGAAWVVVGPYGDDVLLRTDDGGESFAVVLEAEGDLIDAAADGAGTLRLTASQQRMYVAEAGSRRFSLVDQPPGGIGIGAAPDDGTVWATGVTVLTGVALYELEAPSSFETRLHLSALQPPPLRCPATSQVTSICGPLWEQIAARLPLDPDAVPQDSGDSGGEVDSEPGGGGGAPVEGSGGCRDGSAAAALLLLPLAAMGRRRRG